MADGVACQAAHVDTTKRYLPFTASSRTQIAIGYGLSAISPKNQKYPQQDSNLRNRLRRPVLYPLSYGGYNRQSTTSPRGEQTSAF